MYREQETSTEEYEKAMYGKLMKTQSEEEEEVMSNVALCTNDSVSLERKRRQFNKTTPNKYIHNISQSDISLNENPTGNTFNMLKIPVLYSSRSPALRGSSTLLGSPVIFS